VRGFTKKYGVHLLVYLELHDNMPAAIQREKQIKDWKRSAREKTGYRLSPV
jgi:putative endonuclease